MRVELRPTIAADLEQLASEPLPFRIRAITAHIGDQVLGAGGLGYRPDGIVVAFAVVSDEFRRYPAAIHRAGIAAMRMIRASGERRVIAIADDRVPAARRWLEYFRFKPVSIDGVTAYVWQAE
jgi:hypothetical protein